MPLPPLLPLSLIMLLPMPSILPSLLSMSGCFLLLFPLSLKAMFLLYYKLPLLLLPPLLPPSRLLSLLPFLCHCPLPFPLLPLLLPLMPTPLPPPQLPLVLPLLLPLLLLLLLLQVRWRVIHLWCTPLDTSFDWSPPLKEKMLQRPAQSRHPHHRCADGTSVAAQVEKLPPIFGSRKST